MFFKNINITDDDNDTDKENFWFKNSGIPWVKSETGPVTQRARRDRIKMQTTPDW